MPSTLLPLKIEVRGLGRKRMSVLAAKAKCLGLSPAGYVKQLVEDDLAIEAKARSMSLARIMEPVRKAFKESGMTEAELDAIVTAARSRQTPQASSKKR